MTLDPRRSMLSALTFSKHEPQNRAEHSGLSRKGAEKVAATLLAGAAGAAYSVRKSLAMNASLSAESKLTGSDLDHLRLTPMEIAARAVL